MVSLSIRCDELGFECMSNYTRAHRGRNVDRVSRTQHDGNANYASHTDNSQTSEHIYAIGR